MRTMSTRFIKLWKKASYPLWVYIAIAHDADIRCKFQGRVSLYVND